jgi:hypothetical protein
MKKEATQNMGCSNQRPPTKNECDFTNRKS